MGKPTRGLPASFSMKSNREDLEAPVDIGDFLDEELSPRAAPTKLPERPAPTVEPAAPEQLPAEPVVTIAPQAAVPQLDASEPHSPEQASAALAAVPARQPVSLYPALEEEPVSPPRPSAPPPPRDRIQVNLSPEGRAAHNAVMEHFRRFCPREPNTKHNEVYQSLMIALHSALQHYDLSRVPKRGSWGSATHRSFITALKGAGVKAIGQHYESEFPND